MTTRRNRNRNTASTFNYSSQQMHEDLVNGRREAHMKIVEIRNGEGIKRVTNITPSGKRRTKTVRLNKAEVDSIRRKIFIPNLFAPLLTAVGLSSIKARNTRTKKKERKN